MGTLQRIASTLGSTAAHQVHRIKALRLAVAEGYADDRRASVSTTTSSARDESPIRPDELELQKHSDWADEAVELVWGLSDAARQSLMRHIFQVVRHYETTSDRDALVILSHDLLGTIRLHQDPDYQAGLTGPPASPDSLGRDEALSGLQQR